MKTRCIPFSSSLLPFLTFLLIFCATQVATAQVPSYVPTNGLVGYWPFNGNANDEGWINFGTVNGATLTADRFGNENSAYSFDGFDYIEIPTLDNSDYYPVSYSLWFNANDWVPNSTSAGTGAYLIGRKEPGGNSLIHQGILGFWNSPPSINQQLSYQTGWSSSTRVFNHSLSLNQWFHLVFVYTDSYEMLIYVDGQFIESVIGDGSLQSADAPFRIGAGGYLGSDHYGWRGIIDDIGMWNRALTPDEVLSLFEGCNSAPLTIAGNVFPTQFTQETYTFSNNVGAFYDWTVTNGDIISGQGSNSIEVLWPNSGIGNVSVETGALHCSGDVVTYDVVILPTDVEEFSTALSLFPNPSTNEINLQTSTEFIGSDLIIFDALGKQIQKQQILSTNTGINTSAFAAGNYVVKVGGVVKRFELRK
ncbi:MAG: hypothetical protein RL092_992 [Bacteroidota bacterium]|jgi:hypothetical protein